MKNRKIVVFLVIGCVMLLFLNSCEVNMGDFAGKWKLVGVYNNSKVRRFHKEELPNPNYSLDINSNGDVKYLITGKKVVELTGKCTTKNDIANISFKDSKGNIEMWCKIKDDNLFLQLKNNSEKTLEGATVFERDE